ncbi:MAG: succinylglutamate desuccinylase [Myxococcota bacterium]|jgi:succinylglutamate desuccinylase
MSTLQQHLDAFDALRDDANASYRWQATHRGAEHAFHVVVSCLVHGNEVGSLPGINRVLSALRSGELAYGGTFTVVVANPEAGLVDRRFLEQDLNRMFGNLNGDVHECRRAAELAPILASADVYLDLHQTILATEEPFTIFPWHSECWKWARVLNAASACVTRPANQGFALGGQICADEYVRDCGKPGFTLELGQKGFSQAAEDLAFKAVCNLLAAADRIARGDASLDDEAGKCPELVFWQTDHRESFSDPAMCLRDGLVNFTPVEAGDVLSAPGTPVFTAPSTGRLLFPKYPERDASGLAVAPVPSEISRIITEVPEHPETAWI